VLAATRVVRSEASVHIVREADVRSLRLRGTSKNVDDVLGRHSADSCKQSPRRSDADLAKIGACAVDGLQNLRRGEGGRLQFLQTSNAAVMRRSASDCLVVL
jgi:hypothetical protein